VSRPRSRSRSSRVARIAPRLAFVTVAAASIATGIAAGCGIDYEGSLVRDGGLDATENVGASLPEASTDGATDGQPSDASIDVDAAPVPSCADSRCVDAGGQCDLASNTCTFHCDGGSNCDAGLTCPPGVPCHVICAADNVCNGQIDCTQASSCNIACLGAKTCQGVACSGSSCRVACNGMDSCNPGMVVCDAATCDIGCRAEAGMMNCKDEVICQSAVACSVTCNANGCPGGVLAEAPDASIHCGDNACDKGETCRADVCDLFCRSGTCAGKLCCEAGTCTIEGGANICP
jgi:hypothetical protein